MQPSHRLGRLYRVVRAMMPEAMAERIDTAGRLGDAYARYAPEAARLAYLLTGDRALAEDVVQEAFVRLHGRFRDLRNPGAFPWYLRKTVYNLVRSHFRHQRVARAFLSREGARMARTVAAADPSDRDEMWTALQTLPHRTRAAIVLRYYEDLPEAQVAQILECPVGTVKSLVSRGLKRLRGELSDVSHEEDER